MGFKLKPRFKMGELKGDIIGRSKKVVKLTKEEQKALTKFKGKFSKKSAAKKIKKLSKKIDFGEFFR